MLLEGNIEATDCSMLKDILRISALSRNKSVWVDCERTATVSEEALRKMLSLSEKAKSMGVTLLFYQMTPSMKRAVKEAGLATKLHIVPSIAEASHFCSERQQQC